MYCFVKIKVNKSLIICFTGNGVFFSLSDDLEKGRKKFIFMKWALPFL